ncbi:glycoside hydrolase family 15 protein [Streptomyces sp. NPDC094149]|uniref:glycoside hydrolase family 15 protein n=1 Tax=Streptomyces sp. NPDC094149 TaxID=3155079 RepID=UPI003331413F
MSDRPIADYALLADCQTAALVSSDGSIDWLCFPHFDSRAVFSRILDDEGGHWFIRPSGDFSRSRTYLDRSLVLRTDFRTSTGSASLTDALAAGPNRDGHELGAQAPHLLIRVLTCTGGNVDIDVEFAPRPEYGLIKPLLIADDGRIRCHGGPDTLGLSATVPFTTGATARAALTLHAGQRAAFALQHTMAGREPAVWQEEDILAQLDTTLTSWRNWSALHQAYQGPWADLVHHSGRVLQGLTFQPTGAIVAAPTTSLPEEAGGVRNWDYRYAWVRDASFTLDALWVAACPDEAEAFFRWMSQAAAQSVEHHPDLQIMFGIRGERDLTERTLDHLSGWRNSRPVRIGNGAWNQRQLDVYGELLAAARRLRHYLDGLDAHARRFLAGLADAAAARWTEADQGIWEVRSGPQHFLYSKLMCWVALDSALDLAEDLGAADRIPDWTATRHDIRTAIEEHGWNDAEKAYTQAFGSSVLDASVLMMPIVGFTAADSPRMAATIHTVRTKLTCANGLVRRYHPADDGLPGEEGAFLLCTFWLAQALAMAGEVGAARDTYECAIRCANDVGLLAEEIDTVSGELLGNHPQAFSHIGLVNAAWAISQAEYAEDQP